MHDGVVVEKQHEKHECEHNDECHRYVAAAPCYEAVQLLFHNRVYAALYWMNKFIILFCFDYINE